MFNTAANPLGAKLDNAALTRDFPGAGANSHYHDFTFHSTDEIEAGSEILMDYGIDWFKERATKRRLKSPKNLFMLKHDIDWLRDHGICLDNIRVGRSTKRHAGRGGECSCWCLIRMILFSIPSSASNPFLLMFNNSICNESHACGQHRCACPNCPDIGS